MLIGMLRLLPAALVALASGVSVAQMMGGPMSTTQYFPLVDGARYDYVFVSGPRMTATAVMHAGQTWGGASQLTSIHMTFTCKPRRLAPTMPPTSTGWIRMACTTLAATATRQPVTIS